MAITFDSIGGGELAELFKLALKAVGENILDPNMDQEAARGIDISLTFKPKKTVLSMWIIKSSPNWQGSRSQKQCS